MRISKVNVVHGVTACLLLMGCGPGIIECRQENDIEFCTRLDKHCDIVAARDNCSVSRTVDCGTCTETQFCNTEQQCQELDPGCPDTADCTARACGPDPLCGISCGRCEEPAVCNAEGQCQELDPGCPGTANCTARECGPDPLCGISCGRCEEPAVCNASGQCQELDPGCPDTADCTARVCGPDPLCGISCGRCEAPAVCNAEGQCTCEDLFASCSQALASAAAECGIVDDGCGGSLDCTDVCTASLTCGAQGICIPVGGGDQATFERIDIPNGIAGDCKMIGDLDNDGHDDLIIGGSSGSEPLTWYVAPDWTPIVIADSEQEFSNYGVVADINQDGYLDVIVPDATISPNNLHWYENPKSRQGNWTRHDIGNTGSWCKDVAAADYDGDGKIDIAARPQALQPMIFFQESDDDWFSISLSGLNVGNEGMWSACVDADSYQDLIVRGQWARNPGGLLARDPTEWTGVDIGDAPEDFKAFAADMNGDDRIDILYSSSESTADVVWWEQSSAGADDVWLKHVIAPNLSSVHTLWAADMNLDGTQDVVLGIMEESKVSIYYNQGDGLEWPDEQSQTVDANAILHNGQVGDIDGDGDFDIFGAAYTQLPTTAVLWINKLKDEDDSRLGSWTYHQVTSQHVTVFGLTFADLNSDGDVDIVSGPFWYENPGGDLMGNWLQHSLPQANGQDVDVLLSLDVDDDARTDLVAMTPDALIWWLEAQDDTGTNWNLQEVASLVEADHGISSQGYRTGQLIAGGREEIVLSDASTGIYSFTIPDQPSDPWPRRHITDRSSDEGVAIADMDDDGHLDIVGMVDNTAVEWYRNPDDPEAENWTAYRIATLEDIEWLDRCSAADINGDGRVDVVVTEENGASADAQTYWIENPGDATASDWPIHLVSSLGSTNSMEVADFDLDGDIDIVTGEHIGQLRVIIWENDGSGSFVSHPVDAGKESHYGTRPVDLDSDGDLDIVSIAYNEGNLIHLWRNDR